MAGAAIFVMYADGNGNVTISGRFGGQGHVEPLLDSSLMAGLTLLEGSGIVNNTMVANVHCKYLPRTHEPETDNARLGMYPRQRCELGQFAMDLCLESRLCA